MDKRGNDISVRISAGTHPQYLETICALAVAVYFKSKVEFIPTASSHTPDILVVKQNQMWEIKNIRGNSDNTIHHNLSKAKNQSENIIITLYSSKMKPKSAVGRIKRELKLRNNIKRCLLITKQGKIVKIK